MRRAHPNWDRCPSGMQAEHLKSWLAAAKEEEKSDPSRWKIVVEIIHLEFVTGELATECT